jgi:Acetyltransferase (GNAT) domain
MMLKLIKLEERPPEWDQLIGTFPNKNLFHESAWLDFMVAAYPHTRVDYMEIRRGLELVGFFCAIRSRKFIFSMWESPHYWVYMCPVVEKHVVQSELVDTILAHCLTENIANLTLCNDWLDPGVMQTAGFTQDSNVTQICPLNGGETTVWERMHTNCRTRIRKAEKSGLVVESATDPEFIDEFFPLFSNLLASKGKIPGYNSKQARDLFHHLGSADRLFALRVKHKGRVIGTAFYPHDDRAMYYGDAGYEPDSLPLCPNNLLHWTAMKMAIDRGIPVFNMGGGPQPSRFTKKFGGELQPLLTYRKSFVPLLAQARKAYHFFKREGNNLLNMYKNFYLVWVALANIISIIISKAPVNPELI